MIPGTVHPSRVPWWWSRPPYRTSLPWARCRLAARPPRRGGLVPDGVSAAAGPGNSPPGKGGVRMSLDGVRVGDDALQLGEGSQRPVDHEVGHQPVKGLVAFFWFCSNSVLASMMPVFDALGRFTAGARGRHGGRTSRKSRSVVRGAPVSGTKGITPLDGPVPSAVRFIGSWPITRWKPGFPMGSVFLSWRARMPPQEPQECLFCRGCNAGDVLCIHPWMMLVAADGRRTRAEATALPLRVGGSVMDQRHPVVWGFPPPVSWAVRSTNPLGKHPRVAFSE